MLWFYRSFSPSFFSVLLLHSVSHTFFVHSYSLYCLFSGTLKKAIYTERTCNKKYRNCQSSSSYKKKERKRIKTNRNERVKSRGKCRSENEKENQFKLKIRNEQNWIITLFGASLINWKPLFRNKEKVLKPSNGKNADPFEYFNIKCKNV